MRNINEYYFSNKLKEIEALNKQGFKVINLGIGSPDMAPDHEVINALNSSAVNPKNHSYQNYRGVFELRQSIADWLMKTYAISTNPNENILPLLGSKEGIMHISMTYLNPGDEVLIPNPGYPAYATAAKLAGANVKYYNLLENNNWDFQLNEIEQLISSKTKIIWLNFPNMPTGYEGNWETIHQLVKLTNERKILLCNDNPYSLILNNNPKSILSLTSNWEYLIELNSLSKSHNMAGWRLGMLISNKIRIDEIIKFKSNMDSGMFLPIQHAAISALNLDGIWFHKLNNTYKIRKTLAVELLDLLNCKINQQQVGMFVWAKIPENQIDAYSFSDEILLNTQIFITPGAIFGSNGNRYVRVSLCNDEKNF